MRYYTGIGSRSTPEHICDLFTEVAHRLAQEHWVLRSGGAEGADSAFEAGSTHQEIFLPWRNFNNHAGGEEKGFYIPTTFGSYRSATGIAAEAHPNWKHLTAAIRKLHVRNVYQVLGSRLDTPSEFVLCWTPIRRGVPVGGTSQAIRVARRFHIPVINVYELREHSVSAYLEQVEKACLSKPTKLPLEA